jgi:hypothetical protein
MLCLKLEAYMPKHPLKMLHLRMLRAEHEHMRVQRAGHKAGEHWHVHQGRPWRSDMQLIVLFLVKMKITKLAMLRHLRGMAQNRTAALAWLRPLPSASSVSRVTSFGHIQSLTVQHSPHDARRWLTHWISSSSIRSPALPQQSSGFVLWRLLSGRQTEHQLPHF